MSIIKQLSVYDGSQWKIDDIGAQASNITFSGGATILGKSNVQEALSALGGSSALTGSRVVVTDSNGKLSTSAMTANELSNISTELGNKVPTTRTVNGKALSADITLSAADVGAASTSDITAINNTISTINTNLGNKVDKAGDTMTGILRKKGTAIKIGTAPTDDNKFNEGFYLRDANDFDYAHIRSWQSKTSGDITLQFRVQNKANASATATSNTLTLSEKMDGTHVVSVAAPAAWRSALGLSPTVTKLLIESYDIFFTEQVPANSSLYKDYSVSWSKSGWNGVQIVNYSNLGDTRFYPYQLILKNSSTISVGVQNPSSSAIPARGSTGIRVHILYYQYVT